jgi:hypothetical protein
MTFHWSFCLLAVLFLTGLPLFAQDTSSNDSQAEVQRRIQALEQQLTAIREELTALKTSAATPVAQEAAPANNFVDNGASSPGSKTTIASLLGPTYVSGFVDTYYSYNSNHPITRTNGFRSFDTSSNQFSLNLVQLVVDKTPSAEGSRTGYRVAVGFGQAINAVNGSDPAGLGFDQYLKEAYFSYLAPVGKGLQVDVGKFVTPHGAEVIETKDNWNYSRGLLFSYAIPYFHFGLRAKQTITDKTWVSGYVVNGWNSVIDNNTGKTYGVGFGWTPSPKFSFVQNYMAGPEQADNNSDWRQLLDTLVTVSPTSKLSLMANYSYGRGDRVSDGSPVYWNGIAGYVKYAFNNKYAVATRYEYYNDHDGFTTGTAQHFNGVTGTFQRVIAGNLLTRLEFRRDMSNRPTFMKGDSNPVSSQNTVAAGMVFMFDSREAK